MRVLKKELWPYKVKVGEKEFTTSITDIEIWLGEQLGTFKGRWNVVYQYNCTYFYFRLQEDAMIFSLRWS
jgi:hypothetical protein